MVFSRSLWGQAHLRGVSAAAVVLCAFAAVGTPRVAWAQSGVAESTKVISGRPWASVLMVPHNGKRYLFERVMPSEYNSKYEKLYSVSIEGTDGSFGEGKDFGFARISEDPAYLGKFTYGINFAPFTMPFAAVEMDFKNLLVVFACGNEASSAFPDGRPVIKVRNVDALLGGSTTSPDVAEQDITGWNPQLPPATRGIAAAAYARPGLPMTEMRTGFVVAYSAADYVSESRAPNGCISLAFCSYPNNKAQMDNFDVIPLPADSPKAHGWGGDVALQIVPNPGDVEGNNNYLYIAYLALVRKDGIQIGRVRLQANRDGKITGADWHNVQWSLIKTGAGTPFAANPVSPGHTTLNKGLFGDISVVYVGTDHYARAIRLLETASFPFPSNSNAIKLTDQLFGLDAGFPLRNYSGISTADGPDIDTHGEQVFSPPTAFYSLEPSRLTKTKDDKQPDLEKVVVPLMCSWAYTVRDTNAAVRGSQILLKGKRKIAQVGQAQRRVLDTISDKETLIGIIEGPPPFPIVNLNLPDNADMRSAKGSVSSVTSTNKTTNDSKVSDAFSTTQIFKWDAKILTAGTGPATEGERNWLTSGLTEHKNASSLSYAYEQNLTAQINAGKYEARPEATLITSGMKWGGYAYSVVDEQNKRIPGIAEFVEFYPLPDGYHAWTVYLNPNGVRPGDLTSYMKPGTMSPEAWNAKIALLDKNSMIDAAGKHFIEQAWSPSGTAKSQFEASSSDTTESTEGGNTKGVAGIAFKQEVKTDLFGLVSMTAFSVEGKFLGGQDSGYKHTTSAGAGKTQGLTCNTNIRGNGAYGGCTRFAYRVYQLKPDNQHLQDLLATGPTSTGLVTSQWPRANDPAAWKSDNQKAINAIDPNSKPWKITYVVTSAEVYDVVTDPFAAKLTAPSGVTPLPQALKDKLVNDAGLTTPSLLAVALDAVTPTVITTNAFQPGAAAVTANAAVVKANAAAALEAVKISQPSFDSSKAKTVLQSLTDAEKKLVSDYLAAVRATADAKK